MSREFKDAAFGELARLGKAMASPRRLELVDLLAQRAHTVEELARATGQSMANTSHHLGVLRDARLVVGERRGLHVHCRLAGPDVGALWRSLRDVGAERLAEVASLTRAATAGDLERVPADELVRRMQAGEVTVIDTRPRAEFDAGHVPGAVHMPLDELERRLVELPTDRQVVAYCRGPLCLFAVEAVARLRDHGYDAVRLDEGVPEWRARGLAVEVAP